MLTLISRPIGLCLAAASCVVLAACGSSTVIDTAKVSKDIQKTITSSGGGVVKVDTVDCPKDPPAKAGKTFRCTFTLTDGSSGEVTVSIRSDDGAVRWDVTRPAGGQAERVISTGYEQKTHKKVKFVHCPKQLKTGGAVTLCSMELRNGAKGRAAVTLDKGDIHWETR